MTSSEQNSDGSPSIGISKADVRMRGFRDRSEVSDVIKLIEKRIQKLDQETVELELSEKTDMVVQKSGLIPHYRKSGGEKAVTRIENLE